MRIDALASPELRATIYALKSIDKTLAKQVRQYTKAIAGPEWRKAIESRAVTAQERRVLADTAVVSVSNQNVRVQSASKGRPLSGGLNPKTDYAGVEFGANPAKRITSRRNGKAYTRRMGKALPARRAQGPFYRAADNMIPRIASLWVQTTVKTIATALEGKQE